MHTIGIDVSLKHLDVSSSCGASFRFPNSPDGYTHLTTCLSPGASVCMESTGVYYLPLAHHLYRSGHTVYVLNSYQVKSYARSRLTRTKTDKVDAKLITNYLKHFRDDLRPWDPSPDAIELLSLTVRYGEGLTQQRTSTLNRLHAVSFVLPDLTPSLAQSSSILLSERDRVFALAAQIAYASPLLTMWLSALSALPGFKERSSLHFLAHAKDLRRFPTARHFSSFTGLTPSDHQSGNMNLSPRISRIGSPGLRAVLYFAAVSASKTKTSHADFYRSLVARSKPKKVALVALANRLARTAWAVCVSEKCDM